MWMEPNNIVATFTLLYCFIGFILVGVVLKATVSCNIKKPNRYFMLLINLLIAGLFFISLFIVYVSPCEYAQKQVFGYKWAKLIFGSSEGYIFHVFIQTTFIISVYRFLVFCFPKKVSRIFNLYSTIAVLICIWSFSAIIPAIDHNVHYCTVEFSEISYTFSLVCHNNTFNFQSTVNMVVADFCIYAEGVLYGIVLWRMTMYKSKVGNAAIADSMSKKRTRAFWQAFGTWISIVANTIGFRFINPNINSTTAAAISAVITCLLPVYSTAILIIVFNKQVRGHIWRKGTAATQSTQITNPKTAW